MSLTQVLGVLRGSSAPAKHPQAACKQPHRKQHAGSLIKCFMSCEQRSSKLHVSSLPESCMGAACSCHARTRAGGIFSMHVRGRAVLTASKDGSVAFSELGGDGGIRLLRRWVDHHAGVVKCARWRGSAPHVFASCGNDRCGAMRPII